MSIVFKGTDLKQVFVVVKYKYKKRFFLPRWGTKDSPYHYKAQLFKSREDAQTAISTTRGNRKGHKYIIEPAENYFGYRRWQFNVNFRDLTTIEILNDTDPVERVMELDQKSLLKGAQRLQIDSFKRYINDNVRRIEEKQIEIKSLQEQNLRFSILSDELTSFDTEAFAEKFKTKSEDMGAILFSDKEG